MKLRDSSDEKFAKIIADSIIYAVGNEKALRISRRVLELVEWQLAARTETTGRVALVALHDDEGRTYGGPVVVMVFALVMIVGLIVGCVVNATPEFTPGPGIDICTTKGC